MAESNAELARKASRITTLHVVMMISGITLVMDGPAKAGEYYSLSGAGFSNTGLFAYQGFTALPLGTFNQSGPVFRLWAKTFAFDYKTDIIDPHVILPPVKGVIINAQAYAFEAEAGYQIHFPLGRVALFAGGSYRNYVLSPADNRSTLAGDHYDFKGSVDGAIGSPDGGWGFGFNGSYVTGVAEYWAQFRPRYRWASGLEIGLDLASFGGPDYQYGRAGLFFSGFDLTEWGAESTYISAEAGAQVDVKLDAPGGYGAVHLGFRF